MIGATVQSSADFGFTAKPSMAARSQARERIAWLEASKGVGIVLLVVLHVCAQSEAELSPTVVWFLQLFRMPMFFIVSGMLFAPRPGKILLERKLRALIVPYFSFMAAICVLISLRAAVLGRPAPLLQGETWRNMILGGEYLRGDFGVFWFMTCLLFTQLTYNMLVLKWKRPSSPEIVAAIVAIYLAGYALWWVAPDLRTPWALGVVPFGLPFLWFGDLMSQARLPRGIAPLACAGTLLLAACLALAGLNFGMDLKYAEPGPPFAGIALAIALSWLFFRLMHALATVPVLAAPCETIGAASMTIMFLHQPVHFSLRMIGIHSEAVLIVAGVVLPMVFWIIARRVPVASMLFLGTARRIPKVSDRLLAT